MTTIRPGQLTPNEFELAILERLACQNAALRPFIDKLHVLSREYTGVGGYTKFLCKAENPELQDQPLGLDALISMPGVPNGMGAVLFCEKGVPGFLEVFTYGDDLWDGVFEGFAIEPSSKTTL